MKIYIDQGVDQVKLRKLKKEHDLTYIQGHSLEQIFSWTEKISQPFRLDSSYLNGPDLLAGDNALEVQAVIGKGNKNDIDHLYSAYMAQDCNYFITNDKDEFIKNGKRERLEKILPGIKIVTLEEFELAMRG
jgi:hypothetical protein